MGHVLNLHWLVDNKVISTCHGVNRWTSSEPDLQMVFEEAMLLKKEVLASEPAGVHCWAKGKKKSLVWGKGEATEEDLSATLADVAGVVIR